MSSPSRLPVRDRLLKEINERSQTFGGCLLPDADLPDADRIRGFVKGLPRPANAAEASLLKARLLDLAFRWSTYAHARYHGKRRCSCPFTAVEPLMRSFGMDPRWDDGLADDWAAAFAAIGERLRAREDARRLGSALRDRASATSGRPAPARQSETRTVTRAFRDAFGCTPHEVETRTRLAKAVPMIARGIKTESVAADVGYRSKKSLFVALRRFTGLRPSEIRSLSPRRLHGLIERLTAFDRADAKRA